MEMHARQVDAGSTRVYHGKERDCEENVDYEGRLFYQDAM